MNKLLIILILPIYSLFSSIFPEDLKNYLNETYKDCKELQELPFNYKKNKCLKLNAGALILINKGKERYIICDGSKFFCPGALTLTQSNGGFWFRIYKFEKNKWVKIYDGLAISYKIKYSSNCMDIKFEITKKDYPGIKYKTIQIPK